MNNTVTIVWRVFCWTQLKACCWERLCRQPKQLGDCRHQSSRWTSLRAFQADDVCSVVHLLTSQRYRPTWMSPAGDAGTSTSQRCSRCPPVASSGDATRATRGQGPSSVHRRWWSIESRHHRTLTSNSLHQTTSNQLTRLRVQLTMLLHDSVIISFYSF